MRLDRWLSRALSITRTQAKSLIRQGRVSLDGYPATKTSLAVEEHHKVFIDDQEIAQVRPLYIALHKPAGYVCSHTDDGHPSALRLLPASIKKHPDKLIFVGRLDQDTTGLVLLTTDGQWAHRVSSPNHKHPKSYRVDLAMPIDDKQILQLEHGVQLKNEAKPCAPAQIEKIDSCRVRLILQEGRYHQVKRMFAAVGNRVSSLHRESVGTIDVSGLREGTWRELDETEIAVF